MLKKLLLLLVPATAAIGWLLLRGKEPPEVRFAPAVRETLASTLTTNGKVEPIRWAVVRAQAGGPVVAAPVQRGQAVREGQTLAVLGAPEAQAELAAARSRIQQAQAELETLGRGGRGPELAEIENGIARAKSDLERARRELGAAERLAAKNAGTRAEVDAARQAVARAELEIESLERRRAALVTPPDRSAAQARLAEAQAGAAAASQRIGAAQVRSPMAGVLYAFEIKPGAYLNPGDEVGRVGELARLRVIVYVDEPELGRVAKGMPVAITWDALPGRQWKGVVESVPLQVVALGTRQVGEVLCTIENPDLTLIPGTNVNVEVQSNVVQNALTIPKEALRRKDGESGVLLLAGDRVEWRKVQPGAASVTRVQIVSGLSDGDRVVATSEAAVSGGDKVRIAK